MHHLILVIYLAAAISHITVSGTKTAPKPCVYVRITSLHSLVIVFPQNCMKRHVQVRYQKKHWGGGENCELMNHWLRAFQFSSTFQ